MFTFTARILATKEQPMALLDACALLPINGNCGTASGDKT